MRMPADWSEAVADEVRERLRDALETLRRMRMPSGSFPAGYGSGWPDVVQDFWEVYGQHGPKITRIRPSPAAIQRMDLAIGWFHWIADHRQRRALVLRAIPLSWRAVGRAMGCNKDTAIRLERRAVEAIVARLTQDVDICDEMRHYSG